MEQEKNALMVAECTDTGCSNLTLFSGLKILGHFATLNEKSNDLKERKKDARKTHILTKRTL